MAGRPRENHLVLLVVLATSIALDIAVSEPRLDFAIGAGFIVALCFATYLITRRRRPLWFLVPWGVAALALHVAFHGDRGPLGVRLLDDLLWLAFSGVLALIVFRNVLAAARVGFHQVSGAVSVYLLLGILFAQAFEILLLVQPGAVRFVPGLDAALGPSEVLYFSFVTLATVGYGDVYPVLPAARALCVAESVTGILYVAILIARFVGRYEDEGRA